ncbi:Hypothetical protein ABZS17H1_02236 [Kosakonia cowanii]
MMRVQAHTIVVIHYVQNGGYCSQNRGVTPPVVPGICARRQCYAEIAISPGGAGAIVW